NAIGGSGSVLSVSINILAGTAILPSSLDSTCIKVTILVCKSVAEIVRILSLISNKKFSSIGNTVLLLDAPLTACNCFNNTDVDTMNLIRTNYNAMISKSWDYSEMYFKNQS